MALITVIPMSPCGCVLKRVLRQSCSTVNVCVCVCVCYNAIKHFPPETKATFSLKTVKTSAAFIPSFLRDPDEKDGTKREGKKEERKKGK